MEAALAALDKFYSVGCDSESKLDVNAALKQCYLSVAHVAIISEGNRVLNSSILQDVRQNPDKCVDRDLVFMVRELAYEVGASPAYMERLDVLCSATTAEIWSALFRANLGGCTGAWVPVKQLTARDWETPGWGRSMYTPFGAKLIQCAVACSFNMELKDVTEIVSLTKLLPNNGTTIDFEGIGRHMKAIRPTPSIGALNVPLFDEVYQQVNQAVEVLGQIERQIIS